ncbi:hypothetical protein OS493_022225 [Desmophyllum pertusum]|uniref:Uncharacterized protein n=1 Tax=Desmophyllum pertusum TaxID=174260 RepID=A0A9W9YAV0_9CNID|nr:hypothetical protein OS493_022225 [Desmophyllum pertusum]
MAAAKAARRNNFMHELHLPNDPFQDPLIGRRTGVPLNINARKDSHGFDNIDDYFPDSDPEEENVVPNAQSSDKDLLVGRKAVNTSLIQDSEGFENVDDDCPECHQIKESSAPGEVESADTPEGTLDESPNDTGTAIKIPASREPTPQFREQIKKRLAFTNGKSPIESEDDQVQTRNSPRHKSTEPISEQAEESDTEIDIVAVSDDESQLVGQQTSDRSPAVKSAIKTKEKAKKQPATHARKTKNCISMADQDDEVIDIEEIEDETFLTIGGNTTRMTKSVLDKSPVPTRVESFIMSESFVLEGTRHKSMSPEFGSSSDSQAEPEPKANKSKIPVRQKGLPNTKPVQQRATRGRKKWVEEELQKVESEVVQADERATRGRKKWVEEESQTVESEVVQADERATRGRKKRVENESQNVEPEVAQADEKDDEERGSPSSKQEQNKPVRRRKQQVEKAVELETVEVQNSGPEIKYIRKARSLPGTKQQQQQQQEKSTRRARKRDGKTRSVTSDEEEVDDDDKVDSASTAHEEKQGRGRKSMPNATQQLKKVPRGKKQKRDEEIVEYEAVEGNNEDSDVEKPPSRKTRTKKGVEGRKKAEESESVEERSEKADGGNPTEVSGRKTRAQRKKKNDAKLDRKDARERDIDGKRERNRKIENVESENVESEETGQETEESGKDAKVSKVNRKEKPGKGKEDNELENEAKLEAG